MAGRLATGDIEDDAHASSKLKRSGDAGVAASAKTLSPEARKAVILVAARARWKEQRVMTTTADPLDGLLFGHDRKLINLKLLRGDDPQVSESELRAEAHSALLQALLGNCETFADFPEDRDARRINVGDLTKI